MRQAPPLARAPSSAFTLSTWDQLPARHRAPLELDDRDGGDVGVLEVLDQRPAERGGVVRALRALLVVVDQGAAAENGEQHQQDDRDARVHALVNRWERRRMSATPRPARATRMGMSAMFITLVQNTRLSASWRRFLRTSFSSSRVSATRLRKRSSSACWSGVMIWEPLAAGPELSFFLPCSSCILALVFCRSSSSAWILPRYCFCASASSCRTTVSGR